MEREKAEEFIATYNTNLMRLFHPSTSEFDVLRVIRWMQKMGEPLRTKVELAFPELEEEFINPFTVEFK